MKNVLNWLEQQNSEKTAVMDPEGSMTYGEVKHKAQCIGTALAGMTDVRKPVVFYLEKSCLTLCGMFGAVYAGCFYTILDTRQPAARLTKILDRLQAAYVITDAKNAEAAQKLPVKVYQIEDLVLTPDDPQILAQIRSQALDTDPLYVNFTSGSTGTPKGVVVCHRSVLDFIPVFDQTFGIKASDRMGNQAPFDFDVSVKDIYSCLYTGATLVLIPREYFTKPTTLMDYLCDQQVTVLVWAVSAMCFVSIMNGFAYKIPKDIRLVMFSGEVMPMKQLRKWQEALPVEYVNLYGPTEITCNCTYYKLANRTYALDEILPIGKPFDNEKVFLLDEKDQEVKEPGQPGEICVCGTCLALGYYGESEKSAAVFTQNPLNPYYREEMYRTGDLGKYTEDGNLVFAGRKDFQIKHLGHRIELGEIESQVQSLDGISRACCLYDDKKKRIVLFYCGEREEKDLIHELRNVLPPFMVPNKAIRIENMPLNKHGKIDRNALKEQGGIV